MRGEQEVQQLISIFVCSKDRDIEGYLRKDAILFEKLGKSRTFFYQPINKLTSFLDKPFNLMQNTSKKSCNARCFSAVNESCNARCFSAVNESCNARCFSAVNESCNAEKRRKLRFSIVLEKPMLRFYDIDENYVRYLQSVDRQIPNVSSSANSKFVCGIVLRINGINYYAPISSTTQTQRTNLPIIYKKSKVLATIRFSFMFPALSSVLTEKDIGEISKVNPKYAALLQDEYLFCRDNESSIQQKAEAVYRIGCNKGHFLNYTCCDFKLLEQEYTEYK